MAQTSTGGLGLQIAACDTLCIFVHLPMRQCTVLDVRIFGTAPSTSSACQHRPPDTFPLLTLHSPAQQVKDADELRPTQEAHWRSCLNAG